MKLWLLRPNGYGTDQVDPLWEPWYDKNFGFIVRANSEEQARRLAQDAAHDETGLFGPSEQDALPAWLSPEHSTCELLSARGEPGIVMEDMRSA